MQNYKSSKKAKHHQEDLSIHFESVRSLSYVKMYIWTSKQNNMNKQISANQSNGHAAEFLDRSHACWIGAQGPRRLQMHKCMEPQQFVGHKSTGAALVLRLLWSTMCPLYEANVSQDRPWYLILHCKPHSVIQLIQWSSALYSTCNKSSYDNRAAAWSLHKV